MIGRLCRRRVRAYPHHGGVQRGEPLWQGVWGMCPQLPKRFRGRAGGPTQGPTVGFTPSPQSSADKQERHCRLAWCQQPLPPQHSIPYPTAMPTDRSMSSHFQGPTPASEQRPPSFSGWPPEGAPFTRAAGRRRCRLALPPCLPAPTCFPLSISGHLSPRPSTPVRLAPWQIRLVPLCRLFRRPPTGPSDHRPASAWQIRFVSLCRLVRRRSNPSCAASLQARAGRKKRDGQFKATQTLRRSRIPQAEGAGLALPTAAGGGAATTCSCR